MKPSTKARRGRRRKPDPLRDHHTIGATQDPILRARRVAYRRARMEAVIAGLLLPQIEDPFL